MGVIRYWIIGLGLIILDLGLGFWLVGYRQLNIGLGLEML